MNIFGKTDRVITAPHDINTGWSSRREGLECHAHVHWPIMNQPTDRHMRHLGWRLLSQFSPFRYFPIISELWNAGHPYDITFIFDRCHRSSAAETPDNYERNLRYLTYTFAKSWFPVTEKLTNGALVNPTPGLITIHNNAGNVWNNVCLWLAKR